MNIQNNIYTLRPANLRNQYVSSPTSFKGDSQSANNIKIESISQEEIVKWISSADIKDLTAQDGDGNTILHKLVSAEYFPPIRQLLANKSRSDTIINIPNKLGETALDLAKNNKIKDFLILRRASSGAGIITTPTPAPAPSACPTYTDKPTPQDASTLSGMVQTKKPDLMNVFKKKTPETTKAEEKVEVKAEQSDAAHSESEEVIEKSNAQETTSEKTIVNTEQTETQLPADTLTPLPDALNGLTALKSLSGDPKGFEDVIGLDEIKNELSKSIIHPLKESSTDGLLDSNGINIPNGILLTAPAGNGRTFLTKALAAETKLPVVELTNPQELDGTICKIEEYYKKEHKPVILFIRGINNFVENSQYSSNQNVNSFVRNLTDAAKRGILIVATATNKDEINKSVLVPGIIDKVFKFNAPDEDARKALITKFIDSKPVFSELTNPEIVNAIAQNTAGFSVSQIRHVINESARSAAFKNEEQVNLPDLLEEIRIYSKEQDIPEINEFNKTSMYDTVLKREQYKKNDPQSLSDVGGMLDVKKQIFDKIVEPWKHKDEMDKYGIGMPDGILMYGPPGSGKTFIVKAVARELGLPLYAMKLSDVGSSFKNETTNKIKSIITQLKEKYEKTGEASVLFLDELDSLGKSKDGNGSNDTDEVNTLLQELDNAGDKGIIVLAATNKLDKIEGALKRDGRLGERIFVGYADYESRYEMIKTIFASKPVTAEFAKNEQLIEKLAKEFDDMASGSIAKILKEASYQMAVKGQPFEKSLDEAFEKYQEKELDDHLTRKGVNNRGQYLKQGKNSTIKYDTNYDRTYLSDNEPHNFSELGGMSQVKQKLKENVIDLWKPEVIQLFRENKMPMPGGAILSGPSSNGKTTIIRATAGEMGIPLYEINYSDVSSSHIHETSRNEKELFDQLAYKYKKTGEMSALFLDELDKFVPERKYLGSNDDFKKEEVSEMLTLMNDASENGIILLGATNHLEMVDEAIRKNPRRMGCNIFVDLPDEESRMSIIANTLKGKAVASALLNEGNVKELSDLFNGMTVGTMTDTLKKAIINSLIKKQELSIDKIKSLINEPKGN